VDKYLDLPAHKQVTPSFQALSTFDLTPSPLTISTMPPADSIISEITNDLKQMMLDDPIMKALWEGTMKWGDIPGILDKKPRRPSIASITSVASDESEEYDLVRICSHNRRVAFADKPIVKKYNINEAPVTIPQVPPFTVGIKTVITRNLPRDVTVQALRAVFEKYGPIKDIYIPKNMDRSSQYFGTIKGFALIKFLNAEHSAAAYTNEYGRLTLGRNNITIEFAKEDR
jgi:hypothetical protein